MTLPVATPELPQQKRTKFTNDRSTTTCFVEDGNIVEIEVENNGEFGSEEEEEETEDGEIEFNQRNNSVSRVVAEEEAEMWEKEDEEAGMSGVEELDSRSENELETSEEELSKFMQLLASRVVAEEEAEMWEEEDEEAGMSGVEELDSRSENELETSEEELSKFMQLLASRVVAEEEAEMWEKEDEEAAMLGVEELDSRSENELETSEEELSKFMQLLALGKCYVDGDGKLWEGVKPNTTEAGKKKLVKDKYDQEKPRNKGKKSKVSGCEDECMSEAMIYRMAVSEAGKRDSSSSDDIDVMDCEAEREDAKKLRLERKKSTSYVNMYHSPYSVLGFKCH